MTIYLVGTSHIAGESLRKVKETIVEKNPQCVAVELDMNRYLALKTREKGDVKLPILQKAIFMLLRYMQEQLSRETNILPGQEMLQACESAANVGAKVAFIDQDINVTMRRLMKRLGVFGQLKLLFYMVVGLVGIPIKGLSMSKELDLNKVPEDEFIEYAMGELKKHFPAIYEVLVEERNVVMARNLKKLGEEFDDIVAVMGAGHVKGVGELLGSDKD
ncbi:MAG: TraB/GumN family protein [archaeon]